MRMDLELGGIAIGLVVLVFNAGVSWQILHELAKWREKAEARFETLERELYQLKVKEGVSV